MEYLFKKIIFIHFLAKDVIRLIKPRVNLFKAQTFVAQTLVVDKKFYFAKKINTTFVDTR